MGLFAMAVSFCQSVANLYHSFEREYPYDVSAERVDEAVWGSRDHGVYCSADWLVLEDA